MGGRTEVLNSCKRVKGSSMHVRFDMLIGSPATGSGSESTSNYKNEAKVSGTHFGICLANVLNVD